MGIGSIVVNIESDLTIISRRMIEKKAGEFNRPKTAKPSSINKKKNRPSSKMKLKLVQRYSIFRIKWPKFFLPVSGSSINSSASGPDVNNTNRASRSESSGALIILNSEYPGASFFALTRLINCAFFSSTYSLHFDLIMRVPLVIISPTMSKTWMKI